MSDSLAVKPTISVIVPCYNVEVYIDRVLGSLRSQTFSDFEIIAVDDGSSDGTLGRLEGWAGTESRLRIYSQENQGLYHARLSGIALARGEWITFMESPLKYS
ncbi:glycosyltransferase family A protein [Tepidimonas ignava]|uniref:glycosyltransferase family 2 protein n=1 Tax=Tepidimonas ignava TaxID=114249 RepID=UPI002FDA1922